MDPRSGIVVTLAIPFLLVPTLVVWLANLGGWPRLAAAYPLVGTPPRAFWLGYAVFRGWIGYNGCVLLSSDPAGLYLRCWPLLSLANPPAFIPWTEIARIERLPRWGMDRFRIVTRQAADVDWAIPELTFKAVRADAKRANVPGDY